jgi:hypothetical protein
MRYKNKINNAINNAILYTKKKDIISDLLIFDDVFPNPLSDWRYNEFVYYIDNILKTTIITNIYRNSLTITKMSDEFIDNNFFKYKNVISYNKYHTYKAKIGYCIFYNNLKLAFPYFEKHNIPFVFTLYPGGGFRIYNKEFENSLKRYFSSRLFNHVIVNMPHVYDYIKNRFFIDDDRISYIYGAPINLSGNDILFDKKTEQKLKIIFCSHKYMPHGIDKGFDIFNKLAKNLEGDPRFEFICIGGFDKTDLIVPTENIQFKSFLLPDDLHLIFESSDIILSPNRSHVLYYGAFDGFPTASVLHAATCGCMMMISDEMGNSKPLNLIDNEDFVLIAPNVDIITDKILYLANNRGVIRRIAKNGRDKMIKNINQENQLSQRLSIIGRYL